MTAALGYHGMRMRHARALVLAFLRRWGAYGVVAGAVLGAGTNSPWQIVEGAAAALVLPMFQVAAQPAWLAAATAAYALAGTLPVLLTRPLWWPERWRLAERALPLRTVDLRQSDLRLLPWLLAPWLGLQALGVAALWRHNPPELHASRGLALLAWCVSAGAAGSLALLWMQRLRRRAVPRPGPLGLQAPQSGPLPVGWPAPGHVPSPASMPSQGRGATDRPPAAAPTHQARPTGWAWALVWTPLWRGPARRAGRMLGLALMLQAAAGTLMARYPAASGWWLASLTLVALAGASALRVRLQQDLALLWLAARALPLTAHQRQRATAVVALLPCALGLLLAALALPWPLPRLPVAAAWACALVLACALESGRPPADPGHHAARWLMALALLLALGFEVLP